MSDHDLIDAVAQKTGEDSNEIRRRGFVLTGPDDAGPEPECLLDVLLVDLPETGTVDWDALGFGCREPLLTAVENCELRRGLRRREKNANDEGAGHFEKPAPDARAAPPEAHESLISPKTVAEVPLTGLSFDGIPCHGADGH